MPLRDANFSAKIKSLDEEEEHSLELKEALDKINEFHTKSDAAKQACQPPELMAETKSDQQKVPAHEEPARPEQEKTPALEQEKSQEQNTKSPKSPAYKHLSQQAQL